MRVLVTGGAGFIGSNLVRALLTGGNDVLVIDDLSTGFPENLDPRAGFRKMDILDPEFAEVVRAFSPEGVVHLAAQSSVGVSLLDPERDHAVNADGTAAVAVAARAAGTRRMISASSAAVYGEPEFLPLTETARKGPLSPYGSSKLEAESRLASELRGTSTDFASFRFSNVYGPRQNAAGEGGVVAIFCDRVSRDEAPVVFGDGRQTRDFIFVGDVAAAIISALNAEGQLALEGVDGPAYNVSMGTRISIEQLLMSVRTAAHYFGPQRSEEPRNGDIVHSVLDPGKAAETFGWKAGVDIEGGIAFTWRWFSSRA